MEAQSLAVVETLWSEPGVEFGPESPTELAQARKDDIARRDAIGRRLLALADVVAVGVAATVAAAAAAGATLHPFAMLALVPFVLLASKAMGLYGRDEMLVHRTTLDEVPKLIQLATTFAFLAWLMGASVGHASFGRFEAVVLWAVFIGTTAGCRIAARRITESLSPDERCVVVGSLTSAENLARTLARDQVGAAIVANVELSTVAELSIDDLRRMVDRLGAHRLILTLDGADTQITLDLIRAAKIVGVRVSLMPRLLEVIGSQVQFDHIGGALMLGVRTSRLSTTDRLLKRTFDLVISSLVLIIAAPLMAMIALLVKRDSPGPVLYRQPRVGRRNGIFEICKFRTMAHGSHGQRGELAAHNEAIGLFKITNDPRMTRIGRVLRRASFDELPQLFNVLKGEMSLVGPRPLLAEEDALITGFDRHRLDLTPGMTGHWQILGSARVPLAEMVRIDYLYVAGWTLWSDIKLLARTVPFVLSRRGL